MHLTFEQDPAEDKSVTRKVRVGRRSGFGTNLRAGNGFRTVLLDVRGNFVGLALGEDRAAEHDDKPEGIPEALGVPETATCVGDARMTRPVAQSRMRFVDGRGEGDKCATTLIVNNSQASDIRYKKHWLSKKSFRSDDNNRGMWRAMSRLEPTGIVTGWSYSGFGLAGWDEEARQRIEAVHEAYLAGSLAVVLSHTVGPVLLLADRFDPRFPLEFLVHDIQEKRWDVSGTGSALFPAEITVATRPSEVARAQPAPKPVTHRFGLPDGSTVEVPRDVDALKGWAGQFRLPGGITAEMPVYSVDDRCRAPFLPGVALPPQAFTLEEAESLVGSGAGSEAEALRKALASGEALVAGDTLTFPVGEPVWHLCATPRGLTCTLGLDGMDLKDSRLLLPTRDVDAVREAAALLGKAIGTERVKQAGCIDYANPFCGKETVEGLNVRFLARRAGSMFDGWADPGMALTAQEAAARALEPVSGAPAKGMTERFSAFLQSCVEIHLEASARNVDHPSRATLGVILRLLGKGG